MESYTTFYGDVLEVGSIVRAVCQTRGNRGWGIIECLKEATGSVAESAKVRDIDGRAAWIPLAWLQPHPEFGFNPLVDGIPGR